MKKNVCLRIDEELIYEQIYQVEMNQTVAMESLLKAGLKGHIKLLNGVISSPLCKDEFDINMQDTLNNIESSLTNYILKGKNK